MRKIVNWAHRGASGYAPENTLAAFKMAIEMGCDGIECDIRESQEGELIVFHDSGIRRLTGRRGQIDQLPLSKIKTLAVQGPGAFSGERIPSLAETLPLLPAPIRINLEIKAASAQKMVEFVRANYISNRVVLSAFNHPVLFEIRALDPNISLGYLVDREPWDEVFREASILWAVSLNVPVHRVSHPVIRRAHNNGFELHVYTVNDPSEMTRLIQMGVDGLFTNYPDRLADLLLTG